MENDHLPRQARDKLSKEKDGLVARFFSFSFRSTSSRWVSTSSTRTSTPAMLSRRRSSQLSCSRMRKRPCRSKRGARSPFSAPTATVTMSSSATTTARAASTRPAVLAAARPLTASSRHSAQSRCERNPAVVASSSSQLSLHRFRGSLN